MTRFGVQIEKQTSFRGVNQPFSNTYYYEAAVAGDNTAYLNDLIDAIVALEKPQHANTVNFTFARCWTQIGTPSQNQMQVQRALTGTGTSSATALVSMDKERAFLVRFRAGSDSRGRPVYLRKWFHLLVDSVSGGSISSGVLQQTAQLPTAAKGGIEAFGNALKSITPGAGPPANLVSKNGRNIDGATKAHDWLEHHQLGDAWRGG